MAHEVGRIAVGMRSDLLLLTGELQLKKVFLRPE